MSNVRKLSYLLALLILLPALSQAQSLSDDFEGNGNINTWYGDDCGMDPAFANPYQQGPNTSATVLRYNDTGGLYANVGLDIATHFRLDSQPTFSLKIYIPANSITGNQSNQISLKLQDGDLQAPWSTQCEIIKPVLLDQWQTITFDFANDPWINLDPNSPNPTTRTDFNRVLLQVNGENNNDLVTAYIDDFAFFGPLGGNGGGGSTIFTQLVWADEFNGSGAIDTSKWHHQTLLPLGNSWYNGEVQHYTDRTDNSYQDNGNLYILAKRENFTDQGVTKDFTSARLNSKFAFTYGRVEARAKLPFGIGTWPAIWTLGKNIIEPGAYWSDTYGTVYWPACGEIDIMEHWGYNQNYIQSALHTPSSFGATVNLGGIMAQAVSDSFHIYALEWTATEMQFSIDGTVYYTYAPSPQDPDNWPFDAEQYLLLNVAMQGNIDPGFSQSPMVIDYVRVYQEGTTSAPEPADPQGLQLYPNPVDQYLKVQLPEGHAKGELRIYTTQGQLLHHSAHETKALQMDTSAYPPGAYLLVFETEGQRWTKRFLKR